MLGSKTAILLLYVPLDVWTVTTRTNSTRTNSSCPGWVSTTRLRGHFVGTIPLSFRMTISPFAIFLDGCLHLLCVFVAPTFPKMKDAIVWVKMHDSWGSGMQVRGLPIKKWPGVRDHHHQVNSQVQVDGYWDMPQFGSISWLTLRVLDEPSYFLRQIPMGIFQGCISIGCCENCLSHLVSSDCPGEPSAHALLLRSWIHDR